MLSNLVTALALGAVVGAVPAFQPRAQDQRPAPPQAALRPLWTEGSKETRPAPVVILPDGKDEVPNGNDMSTFAWVADRYLFWGGNGLHWSNKDYWGDFDQLWNLNEPLMRQSCEWNDWLPNNSDRELKDIKEAIIKVAGETGVEARFILSIVMQESGGCVRVRTTDNGVRNPGLMQSHNGDGDCFKVSPCPTEQIYQMIRDGTSGTAHGEGLQQILANTTATLPKDQPHRATFAAARKYNSGSVNFNDLNEGFSSIHCYACDVANRLTGWTRARRTCNLDDPL